MGGRSNVYLIQGRDVRGYLASWLTSSFKLIGYSKQMFNYHF